MSNAPVLSLVQKDYDQTRYGALYAELINYHVSIPGDVDKLGFEGFNKLYSDIQGQLNRVSQMKIDATRDEAEANALAIATLAAYEAKFEAKLAAEMASKSEGEPSRSVIARVRTELNEDFMSAKRAEIVHGLISAYLKTVGGVQKNLENAKSNLESQNNNYKKQLPPVMFPMVGGPSPVPGSAK